MNEIAIIGYLLLVVAMGLLPAFIAVLNERRLKKNVEYKMGYKAGYENGDFEEYKKMNNFVRQCVKRGPERNYARGYVNGCRKAEEDKATERKSKMCKSGMEFIRKSMDEN